MYTQVVSFLMMKYGSFASSRMAKSTKPNLLTPIRDDDKLTAIRSAYEAVCGFRKIRA